MQTKRKDISRYLASMQKTIGCFLIVLAVFSPTYATEGVANAEYQSVIAQARSGHYEPALTLLKKLTADEPATVKYLYDYVTVLGWAGYDADVFAQISNLNLSTTPTYVLEILAKAARNTKHFDEAINIYQAAIDQNPRLRQSHIGIALSLADAKRSDEALSVLDALLISSPDAIDVLKAKAYVYESKRDAFNALSVYNSLLVLNPKSVYSLRGRILNTSRLGAPQLAITFAQEHPEVLTKQDMAELVNNKAALFIQWGRQETTDPKDRYKNTDIAIDLLSNQLKKMENKSSRVAIRISFDLLVAYRDRRFMNRAITLYEGLEARGTKFPAYVLHAAGDAYLYLKQPEKARLILEQALALQKNNIEIETTLFYAYLETEEYKKALAFIDQVAKSKKTWLTSAGSKERRWNPEKLQIDITAALARAFTGNLSEGEERLTRLAAAAPNNIQIRNELAHVYLWRGWPERALSEFSAIKTLSPEYLGAKTGTVDALASLGDLTTAENKLAPLVDIYSRELSIKRLSDNLKKQRMREVYIESNGGKSTSTNYAGSKDFSFDGYYYDRYISDRWRPFVRTLYQMSEFDTVSVDYGRLGAGLDYRARNVSGKLEINADDDFNKGMRIDSAWRLNDYWELEGALDSNSSNTPLRARARNIKSVAANFGINYQVHESRGLSYGLDYQNFSDGNHRYSQFIYARQRLISKPAYTLEGSFLFYLQLNSDINAAYFNPRRINSSEFTLVNEWKTYRRYERSFRQRLSTTFGATQQQGFSSGLIWNMGYEHSWDFSSRFSLNYGISYGKSMYDGNSETAGRGFMTLNKRF